MDWDGIDFNASVTYGLKGCWHGVILRFDYAMVKSSGLVTLFRSHGGCSLPRIIRRLSVVLLLPRVRKWTSRRLSACWLVVLSFLILQTLSLCFWF
jgi:hypothetical protein